jgi:hypothetical protein
MDDLGLVLKGYSIQAKNLRQWDAVSENIYLFDVEAASALSHWQKLRALVDATGYWPVILGDQSDLSRQEKSYHYQENASDVATILSKGEALNGEEWLVKEWDEMWEFEADREAYHAPWPDNISPVTDFATITKAPEVIIGLIPTDDSWKVLAYLNYGYWNSNPSADVHIAVHRYWQNMYQAELIVATHDILQLRVGKPPCTREEALKLAQEQFTYCGDNVYQGMGSIEALAATLLNGTVWYFWWD